MSEINLEASTSLTPRFCCGNKGEEGMIDSPLSGIVMSDNDSMGRAYLSRL